MKNKKNVIIILTILFIALVFSILIPRYNNKKYQCNSFYKDKIYKIEQENREYIANTYWEAKNSNSKSYIYARDSYKYFEEDCNRATRTKIKNLINEKNKKLKEIKFF